MGPFGCAYLRSGFIKSDFKISILVFGMKMLEVILNDTLIIILGREHAFKSTSLKSTNNTFQTFVNTFHRDYQTTSKVL